MTSRPLPHRWPALMLLVGLTAACSNVDDGEVAVPATIDETAREPIGSDIESRVDEIDRAIGRLPAQSGVDAAAIAVMANGEIVHETSVGDTPDGGWQVGSISKPVAAFGALTLVEDGVLDLDAPLTESVIDTYLDSDTSAGDVDALTLRTVLTHTSGLPNDPLGTDRSLLHPPGASFTYSGGGFSFVQRAIEDQTGIGFDAFMERDILPQLAMTSSRFSIDLDGEPVVLAAASLTSTPTDVARFLIRLTDPPTEFQKVVDIMTEQRVEVTDTLSWGHGIGIYHDSDEAPLFWHWGTNFGKHHALAAIDANGDGIVLTATGPAALDELDDIANLALNTDHRYWDDIDTT